MDALTQLNSALTGRYLLEREIGRGGMATVYLARDARHNRRVALKVLNPELGAVLGVERFLAEIQVTANLQHPNLLPLFDSGEADGLLFYVMPYVEGESLRATLEREKQLPIEQALHIATSVASALDYAHRHGVIHRDLKPENILLHEGQPLVADFGIALAVSNAGGNRITQTGLSLGTPQYMSPEQATGDRTVDGRTDVYSLGAVTYEMLAGEPPHSGTTAQAIIAKVITDKPRSLRLSRDTVTPRVEAAVERALAKLPADRFHTAQEFADALTGKAMSQLVDTGSRAVTSPASAVRSSARAATVRRLTPWAISVVAVVAAVIAWRRPSPRVADVLRYEIRSPHNIQLSLGRGNPIAISRDGRYVAYVAGQAPQTKLFLRTADELQGREVAGSDLAGLPFFSPDSRWVGFWSNGQLKKAALAGGAAVLLADLPDEYRGNGSSRVSWSPSGRLVLSVGNRLATVPEAGGVPKPLCTLDATHGETAQIAPLALSDGKHVLYTSLAMGGPAAARIGVASLDDGTATILDVQGSYPVGLVDDYLIYTTAAGAVMAVPLDLKRRRVTGVPVPVIDQVMAETGQAQSYIDMSPDGALVYLTGVGRRRLVQTTATGVKPILADPENYAWPRVSPDGRRLAVTRRSSTRSDIWLYDLPSGPLVRLTTVGTTNDRAEWLADSKTIIYRSNRGGLNALWSQPVDGSGDATLFFGVKDAKIDEGVVSPDGRYLLFQRDVTGRGELWYKALTGDTASRRVGAGAFGETGGRFSPDSKWVVYVSGEFGVGQVYVRPFPALGARYQISQTGGGAMPLWSPDGKRIFYRADRHIVAATIGSTQPFSITGRTDVLSENEFNFITNGIHADYDVLKDGHTFLAFQTDDDDTHFVVVQNWVRELHARVLGANP
jgi:serine/threonine-protein kinase